MIVLGPCTSQLDMDEQARLRTMYETGILDTESHMAFDYLAYLAQSWFDTPISLLTFVDEDRLWFKANLGLEHMRETKREGGFCSHGVAPDAPGIFIVEDALEDERFRDHPLVAGETGARFYAGVPIMLGGKKLGMLSVIDTTPRRGQQASDYAYLQELTGIASSLMSVALPLSLQEQEFRGTANARKKAGPT